MLRSILSVVAGITVLTAASFAIEAGAGLLLLRMFPQALPASFRVLTFAYGFLCVAAGGYVAAILAPRLPVRHAAAMGIVQAGLTVVAMLSPVSTHASRLQWILTAVLSIPAAMAGGTVYERKESRQRLRATARPT